MTHATVLRPIILLSRTVSANHAVGVLVRMVAVRVVALVAGEHFGAAAEAEPAVGFAVVGAAAAPGQGLARDDAEGFFGPFADGGAVGAGCGGGD